MIATNNLDLIEAEAQVAKRRLLSARGDPFVYADWKRVVFLHFAFPAEVLKEQIAGPFELELHKGRGIVTIVALCMSRFRPAGLSPACVFPVLREQQFLNLRTYARHNDEPGALFLWGWLSRPFKLPLPRIFGLPYASARMNYNHEVARGVLEGQVEAGSHDGRMVYQAKIDSNTTADYSTPESLAAFALERYTGFFNRAATAYIFRAWHAPWKQIPIDVTVKDLTLITNRFPWFAKGQLAGANFAPGFPRVWLGRAHRLKKSRGAHPTHHGLSAFYEMP